MVQRKFHHQAPEDHESYYRFVFFVGFVVKQTSAQPKTLPEASGRQVGFFTMSNSG
jgi:hypothetical protein